MPYSKVQFISYEVNTFPKSKLSDNHKTEDITFEDGVFESVVFTKESKYTGNMDENVDVFHRVDLMEAAINKAAASGSIAGDDTLKIFMAPEFYFRGADGAYDFPSYDALINKLNEIPVSAKYEHWLFVFGSALVAFKGHAEKAVVNPKGTKEEDKEQVDKDTIICNVVPIKKGGPANHEMRCVIKEHMSGIDFLTPDLEYFGEVDSKTGKPIVLRTQVIGLKGSEVTHAEAKADETGGEENKSRYGGTGVFTEGGIKFGVEICLDHALKRLLKNGAHVQVQLIPSAGMDIRAGSLVASKYAFNVDGNKRSAAKAITAVATDVDNPGTIGADVNVLDTFNAHSGSQHGLVRFGKFFEGGDGGIKVYAPVTVAP